MNSPLHCLFSVLLLSVMLSGCQNDKQWEDGDGMRALDRNFDSGAYNLGVTVKNDLAEPIVVWVYSFHNQFALDAERASKVEIELEAGQQGELAVAFTSVDDATDVAWIVLEKPNSKWSEHTSQVSTVPVLSDNPLVTVSQVENWHRQNALIELGNTP